MAELVTLQSLPPGPQLAPYIREVQLFRINAPAQRSIQLHHLPTGNVSLWICFGTARLSSQRYGPLPPAALIGIHDHTELYHFTGCGDVVNVLFHVVGVRTFVPFPLSELVNRMAPIDAIWPRWMAQSIAELERFPFPERASALLQLLHDHVFAPEQSDERVNLVSRIILHSQGRFPVLPIMRNLGLSTSQIERLCRNQFGLPPKRLARIARFYTASRQMRVETPVSWAAFADAAGYADQAHFIREFRHFTGYTPTAFLQSRINAEFLQYEPPDVKYVEPIPAY
jgi:AraC-like DNA-binding protein